MTSAAIRVSRAYTGRDKVACCGYHGWQDWYIGATERNKGVPGAVRELTKTFEYNRIDTLHRLFRENPGEIAAVIMEPVGAVPPENHFLHQVQELARREGAVFILDEIITGFRFAMGGAQEFFGVIPDLATFGKAMSNGMPLSALVGRAEIMKEMEEVFFSFTFGGEALSLAASLATIKEMKEKRVLEHIWRQGAKLQEGYNRIAGWIGPYGLYPNDGISSPSHRLLLSGRRHGPSGDEEPGAAGVAKARDPVGGLPRRQLFSFGGRHQSNFGSLHGSPRDSPGGHQGKEYPEISPGTSDKTGVSKGVRKRGAITLSQPFPLEGNERGVRFKI